MQSATHWLIMASSYQLAPVYQEFRAGDVRHSQADVSKAKTILGFEPSHTIWQGLDVAMPWYLKQ